MNAFQTEMILNLAATKETISRRDVIEHLRVSGNRANYLLRIMKKNNLLTPVVTKGRGANYRLTVKE
jgi:predicted HTH transcriptional regulator